MNRQSRQLVILLIVLVLLAGGFFGLRQYNKVQSEKGVEDNRQTVVEVPKEDIIKLTYDYEGVTYTYEKVDDTWYLAEDHSVKIMQYLVGNMLTLISSVKAEGVIENVTDMTQYGLAEPTRTVSFETENSSYIFNVGEYNAVSGVYYICKPSENTVYAVESGTISIFDKTLEDMKDPVENAEDTAAEATQDPAADIPESAQEGATEETPESASKGTAEQTPENAPEAVTEDASENTQ